MKTGNVIGASKIARDITERIRTERRRTTHKRGYKFARCLMDVGRRSTQLLEAMASSGDWAFAAIWTYDEAAGGLRCRNVWHEASERVKKFSDLSLVITLPEGQGLPGRVWNSKKPTWV